MGGSIPAASPLKIELYVNLLHFPFHWLPFPSSQHTLLRECPVSMTSHSSARDLARLRSGYIRGFRISAGFFYRRRGCCRKDEMGMAGWNLFQVCSRQPLPVVAMLTSWQR